VNVVSTTLTVNVVLFTFASITNGSAHMFS